MTTADALSDWNCPRCGAALQPGQDWCLNCGAAVTTEVAGAPGWRTPIAIVGVVLLLAAAALVFAFLQLSDNADKVAQAPPPAATPVVPTGPTGTTGPTGVVGAPTGPTGAITPTPSPSPSATPSETPTPGTTPAIPSITPSPSTSPSPTLTPAPPTSGGTFADWPAGKHGWTVVMYSGTTRAAAEAKASSYQSQGKSVGILHSNDYSSLNPGYWVVWSGQYDSKSQATSAAKGLQSTAPGAYAREITPK